VTRAFNFISERTVFENKISCSSLFDSVSVRIPFRLIRDYSTLIENHNLKASPSARCVCADNDTCKHIDIFNKDYSSLPDML
jgi:hypothetical protein